MKLPVELRNLDMADRMALAGLKMADATFQGYAGAQYGAFSGGGSFVPQDFHGAAGLLVGPPPRSSEAAAWRRRRAALHYLQRRNPIVRDCLTAMERQAREDPTDAFPAGAGGPSGAAVVALDALEVEQSQSDDDQGPAAPPPNPATPPTPYVTQQAPLTGAAVPFSELPRDVQGRR